MHPISTQHLTSTQLRATYALLGHALLGYVTLSYAALSCDQLTRVLAPICAHSHILHVHYGTLNHTNHPPIGMIQGFLRDKSVSFAVITRWYQTAGIKSQDEQLIICGY